MPPAPVPDLSTLLSGLTERLDRMEKRIVAMDDAFRAKIEKDTTQKEAFDKLYEDLQRYRDNFLLQTQKPIFMDLILLYDDMTRSLRTLEDGDPGGESAKQVSFLREIVLEILYRRDVEPIEEMPEGDARHDALKFDKHTMKAVKRVDTLDPELDQTIEQVIRAGFRKEKTILRPTEVIMRRHKGDGSARSNDRKPASEDELEPLEPSSGEALLEM
jgi:molecular chaperone GrpE (heat shock protein)